MHQQTADAALALTFLTIVPLRWRGIGDGRLGASSVWFPIVGALIGGAAGSARLVAGSHFGTGAATALAMIILVALAGALHQDGLADCADGLGVRGDRDRRLEVMRDSAIGVFGALALIGWALLAFTLLEQLSGRQALAALIAACALARWTAPLHTWLTPPARPDGLGAAFAVSATRCLIGGTIAIAISILVLGLIEGIVAGAATIGAAGLSSLIARRLVGGRTGDTIGATIAATEIVALATIVAVS